MVGSPKTVAGFHGVKSDPEPQRDYRAGKSTCSSIAASFPYSNNFLSF